MSVELINPEDLSPATERGFAHVGVASGSRLVFLAGQVSEDADGNLVGAGDLAAQAERALSNVVTALAAAGASYDDVVKATYYVVDWYESKLEPLTMGFRAAATRLGIDPIKPSTLVSVTTLAVPDGLIELDVVAVID